MSVLPMSPRISRKAAKINMLRLKVGPGLLKLSSRMQSIGQNLSHLAPRSVSIHAAATHNASNNQADPRPEQIQSASRGNDEGRRRGPRLKRPGWPRRSTASAARPAKALGLNCQLAAPWHGGRGTTSLKLPAGRVAARPAKAVG